MMLDFSIISVEGRAIASRLSVILNDKERGKLVYLLLRILQLKLMKLNAVTDVGDSLSTAFVDLNSEK